ncbi:MAG: hypothetical protein HOG76_03750 [Candidatus Marinimicrobia bacterium]|jgi:hypothetical protein|nr:hypothetical protein [Candidatus Neomarinimicrobiota bacterium]
MKIKNKLVLTWISSLVAIIFGLMTLRSGASTLFIEETRAAAGDIVPFVLWINFILGFAYIAAGAGILMGKSWAKNLSLAIVGITLLNYAAFGIHIAMGGLYIMKTVKAMAVRSLIWMSIAYQTVRAAKSKNQI